MDIPATRFRAPIRIFARLAKAPRVCDAGRRLWRLGRWGVQVRASSPLPALHFQLAGKIKLR